MALCVGARMAAFKEQFEQSPGSDYLFPGPRQTDKKPHNTNLRKAWTATLKRASGSYFSLYERRFTSLSHARAQIRSGAV